MRTNPCAEGANARVAKRTLKLPKMVENEVRYPKVDSWKLVDSFLILGGYRRQQGRRKRFVANDRQPISVNTVNRFNPLQSPLFEHIGTHPCRGINVVFFYYYRACYFHLSNAVRCLIHMCHAGDCGYTGGLDSLATTGWS